jgi:signal peptidase I
MIFFRWFISQTMRQACATHKHYRKLLAAQRDLLAPTAIAAVQIKLDELHAAMREGHTGRMRIKMKELQFAAEKNFKVYPHAAWRENVEVLLVALSVAMAIRTFFLQPFKIPTGSMQPTLFGINSTPDFTAAVSEVDYFTGNGIPLNDLEQTHLENQFSSQKKLQNQLEIPTGWNRVKAWVHGSSYLHFVAPTEGKVENIFPVQKILIFNLCQSFMFAGEKHTLWFPPDFGESDLRHRAGLLAERVYHKGDEVIKLRCDAGDHLFVDRLSYNFRKPLRGDTIVFETAGIPEDMRERWRIPADEFYIKRLVGLPGEKVSIGDDRHLRINGVRLDDKTPHFENVYGFDPSQPPRDSQWSGHVNGTVAREYGINNLGNVPLFPDAETVYDVPTNGCMPMGDNTCNSLDSRFWGAIPEDYVIGKSFFVYWPITSRFGTSNR